MKRCPRCHQTYTDETLKFCRDDGTLLQTNPLVPESSDTLILPSARTNVAQSTQLLPSETAQAKESTSPIDTITLAAALTFANVDNKFISISA